MDYIPTNRQAGNQVFVLAAMLAHNLNREIDDCQGTAASNDCQACAAVDIRTDWYDQPEADTTHRAPDQAAGVQKLGFGAKVEGQTFRTATTSRPRFNIFSLEQDLADCHYRLANSTIERLDWQEAVRRYDRPHTLFHCDPPYPEIRGYGVAFPWENDQAMADLARSIQGTMIISINDHPAIRQVFTDLPCKAVDYKYTVGGGEKATKCVELTYGNWPDGVPTPRGSQDTLF